MAGARTVSKPYRVSRLKGCGRGVYGLELLKTDAEGFTQIATAPHDSEGARRYLGAMVDSANALPTVLAALRAILPYAESRLEDMEEHAREVADDPRLGPQADADVRKARAAFQAAQNAVSATEGRA